MMTRESIFSVVRKSLYLLVPRMPLLGVDYEHSQLVRDVIAGATVAAVLIPQSMAYALLAGLPPAHGLYAALIGGIAGALWSHSRYLATGPIALTSLLTLTAVSPLATPGSTEFIALVAALAVLSGLLQIGFGLARLGFLVRLVPRSVLTGFSAAAAIVIVITQVPHMLGVSVASGDFALQHLLNSVREIVELNPLTLGLSLTAGALLILLRSIVPRVPGALLVVGAGIACAYFFDLASQGVRLAGEIPSGLPIADVPTLSLGLIVALFSKALIIGFVGFMSSYAVAKDIAHRTGEKVHADQELIAQGVANLLSGLFRGYPVGGSVSRTAVNYSAGAVTAWSGVFASLFVLVAILFLSPFLAYLPNAVLAAIVVAAVLPLIDISQLKRVYHIMPTDGAIALATFCAVFIARPDEAILLGVILALGLYMQRMMWSRITEVGIHPEWNIIHIRESFPEVQTYPGVLMLRVDAPLFYANAERLHEEVMARVMWHESEGEHISRLVLDFSGVNHIDVTGVEGFVELVQDLKSRGVQVVLITLKRPWRAVLEKSGVLDDVLLMHNVDELKALVTSFRASAGHEG